MAIARRDVGGLCPPPRRLGSKRTFTLPVDDIRPWIRIAHRSTYDVRLGARIIFDHEFVLFTKGRGVATINRRRIEIRPHRLFVVRPYELNNFWIPGNDPVEHYAIHFDLAPGVPGFSNKLGRRPPYEVCLSHGLRFPDHVDLSPRHPLELLLINVVTTRASESPTSKLEASVLLSQAILLLLKSGAEHLDAHDRRNEMRVRRAVDFLHAHLAEDLNPADLAEVAGVSLPHLARLFGRWIGHSPADFLRRVRIDRARELLADIDYSIKEIAQLTGFKSPYHFSRVFHQLDGLTPTLYRDAVLGGKVHDPVS